MTAYAEGRRLPARVTQSAESLLRPTITGDRSWTKGARATLEEVLVFLSSPPEDDATSALYGDDLEADGHVMNPSRLWARRPEIAAALSDLRSLLVADDSLSSRERAVPTPPRSSPFAWLVPW